MRISRHKALEQYCIVWSNVTEAMQALLCKHGYNASHVDYVINRTTTRQVHVRTSETLHKRSEGCGLGHALCELVPDIPCTQIGEHQHICIAGYLRTGGLLLSNPM